MHQIMQRAVPAAYFVGHTMRFANKTQVRGEKVHVAVAGAFAQIEFRTLPFCEIAANDQDLHSEMRQPRGNLFSDAVSSAGNQGVFGGFRSAGHGRKPNDTVCRSSAGRCVCAAALHKITGWRNQAPSQSTVSTMEGGSIGSPCCRCVAMAPPR